MERVRVVELTKEEIDLAYYQLLARKDYFEEQMVEHAQSRDLKEVKRCYNAVESLQSLMNKLLNSDSVVKTLKNKGKNVVK